MLLLFLFCSIGALMLTVRMKLRQGFSVFCDWAVLTLTQGLLPAPAAVSIWPVYTTTPFSRPSVKWSRSSSLSCQRWRTCSTSSYQWVNLVKWLDWFTICGHCNHLLSLYRWDVHDLLYFTIASLGGSDAQQIQWSNCMVCSAWQHTVCLHSQKQK